MPCHLASKLQNFNVFGGAGEIMCWFDLIRMKIFTIFKRAVSPGKQSAVRVVSFLMAIGLFTLSGGVAQAAIIANYTFTGSSLASSDTEANSTAGNIISGPALGKNSGVDGGQGNGVPSFKFDNADSTKNFNANVYIAFTVTADSGFILNLSGSALTFDARGQDGNGNWAVRSSLDNYAANIATGAQGNKSFTAETTGALSTSYDGLSSITFRIYDWNTKDKDGWVDNIVLNGSVVPEPVTVALGIFGAGFGVFQVGRWLRRPKSAPSVG